MHDAMRDRSQRLPDLLMDQLIAEDVLEEPAMLADHGVDLALRLPDQMHRVKLELLQSQQIGHALRQLRGVDDELLARNLANGLEHDGIRRIAGIARAV